MAITQVGSATTGSINNGNSIDINKPTGVASGDILICALTQNENTITAPSGWTLLHERTTTDTTNIFSGHIFYKVAGGSEPSSYTWGHNGDTSAPYAGVMSAWRGFNASNPINTSTSSVTGAQGDPANGPSITTTALARRIMVRCVRVFNSGVPAGSFTVNTSGWSELAEAAGTSTGSARYSLVMAARDADETTTGFMGTSSTTCDQTETDNVYFHLALELINETDASATEMTHPSTTANKPTPAVKTRPTVIG